MSAVIRTKRFKKMSASTPALWLLLGLAVTFFLVRFGQEVLMEHDLNQKILLQQGMNSSVADDNARLGALLEYYKSDKYIEQRAREDLNLRRADEEVLIPVTVGEDAATSAPPAGSAISTQTQAEPGVTQPEQGNWEKWLGLFSPFAESP